jgi:extracellular factor (EF) 3-hydroxypalmitic acid methyl ester biosynthesis protein
MSTTSNGNFVHENLKPKLSSEYLVRQDRIEVDSERIQLKYEGIFYPVLNFSSFGISIRSEIDFNKNNLYTFDLYVDAIKVTQITSQFVRSGKNEFGDYCAFSLDSTAIDIETVNLVKSTNNILGEMKLIHESNTRIDDKFKVMTFELKYLVDNLEGKINVLESEIKGNDAKINYEKEQIIATLLSQALSESFNSYYKEMENIFANKDSDFQKKHFDFFRTILGEKLYKAPYAHRTYFKPKGYAGDYEMMNIMYSGNILGDSLFAKCLHRYFIDEPASIAVKNREQYLRRKIKAEYARCMKSKGTLKIISIASGPAMEIQNLLLDDTLNFEKIEINLLDQDLEALKHAQFKILSIAKKLNIKINLKLHNLAIKNVIGRGLPSQDYDLIYSAGLFDYFTDPVASYAAEKLYTSLDNSGLAIIGNFGIYNPNRFGMDMVLDWNLIYRSEDDLEKLFKRYCNEFSIESEEKGINLFANLRK